MLRQLAGQTAIYGISSIVSRLLNYLLTPFLTRIMTTGEYGVITDMYALIPFAMVVLTMGMETGYFRFAGKAEGLHGRQEVFSTPWGRERRSGAVRRARYPVYPGTVARDGLSRSSFVYLDRGGSNRAGCYHRNSLCAVAAGEQS